ISLQQFVDLTFAVLGFDVGKDSTIITDASRTDDHAQERKPFTRTIELSKLVPVTVPWNLSGCLLRYYSSCAVQIDQQQSPITLLLSTTTSARHQWRFERARARCKWRRICGRKSPTRIPTTQKGFF